MSFDPWAVVVSLVSTSASQVCRAERLCSSIFCLPPCLVRPQPCEVPSEIGKRRHGEEKRKTPLFGPLANQKCPPSPRPVRSAMRNTQSSRPESLTPQVGPVLGAVPTRHVPSPLANGFAQPTNAKVLALHIHA